MRVLRLSHLLDSRAEGRMGIGGGAESCIVQVFSVERRSRAAEHSLPDHEITRPIVSRPISFLPRASEPTPILASSHNSHSSRLPPSPTHLESKVLERMSYSRQGLVPASSLDNHADRRRRLAYIDTGHLDTSRISHVDRSGVSPRGGGRPGEDRTEGLRSGSKHCGVLSRG
jgi:hypothetical protein